jgi:hypothetical protein
VSVRYLGQNAHDAAWKEDHCRLDNSTLAHRAIGLALDDSVSRQWRGIGSEAFEYYYPCMGEIAFGTVFFLALAALVGAFTIFLRRTKAAVAATQDLIGLRILKKTRYRV